MKKHLLFFLLVVFSQLTLVNCQDKVDKKTITYTITPEFSAKIDKPEVHFTTQIPKDLIIDKPIVGKKNSSFGMIQKKDKDSVVIQMYSFSYINAKQESLNFVSETFLNQIKSMLQFGGYEMIESKIEEVTFDDEKYFALQAIGKMSNDSNPAFKGTYFFNVILKPNPYRDTHIIMLMSARDDQNINNYEDFKDKLEISTIWQNFKYIQ
ncbi:hypothetical protein [Mesoflavibacter zeaxanthinifaciens]|uniref:hypothetical protein n=1 Tax=Mesoflavibacter zeaxanthinifaciens TaxID=393060 RepID=UPI003A8D7D2C